MRLLLHEWCFFFVAFALCGLHTGNVVHGKERRILHENSFLSHLNSFPFANDGIVDPPVHTARYRRNEYPTSAPFYQWWYFTVKDLQEQRYWAITYGTSQISDRSSSKNAGSYFLFADVDHSDPTKPARMIKYEKYPVDALQFRSEYDSFLTSDDSSFSLTAIDNSTYHLYGCMNSPGKAWMTDSAAANIRVEWNITLHRIFGWYGQEDLTLSLLATGLIGWNTYTHDAEVEGTIRIGDQVFELSRSSRYRAYGDQNFGKYFPVGSPEDKYNWGWYSVVLPNDDHSKEVSVIAGVGTSEVGFPVYTAHAAFADIRVGNFHLGVRYGGFWDYTPLEEFPLHTSNDGKCHRFDFTRGNWTEIHDEYGVANIPMSQSFVIETDHYRVTMHFESKTTDYDRLLFAHQDYIFSDFEGLGVFNCLQIDKRESVSDSTFPISVLQTCSNNGGLEFGYKINM